MTPDQGMALGIILASLGALVIQVALWWPECRDCQNVSARPLDTHHDITENENSN